jgi:hypothetical protein
MLAGTGKIQDRQATRLSYILKVAADQQFLVKKQQGIYKKTSKRSEIKNSAASTTN